MSHIHSKSKENKKIESNNNVCSFPQNPDDLISGIQTNSTTYAKDLIKNNHQKKHSKYVLNIDWLQFIGIKMLDVEYSEFKTNRIHTMEVKSENPNFLTCYDIILDNINTCELYINPIKGRFKDNEVLIRVKNNILYTDKYLESIHFIIEELRINFSRFSRIDICLDGFDNLKLREYLRRYIRNKTVLIGNENLNIHGISFDKKTNQFRSYSLGSKKSQKSAKLYNKSLEIKDSEKNYISNFWQKNNLDVNREVGRFEISLGSKYLKKYEIKSLMQLSDISFVGSLFKEEVSNWLKLYHVKFKDLKAHRKEIAIRKGKQIKFINWQEIPTKRIGLEMTEVKVDPINNAKRTITFAASELINAFPEYISTTGSTMNCLVTITNNYGLEKHASKKLQYLLSNANNIDENTKSAIIEEFNAKTTTELPNPNLNEMVDNDNSDNGD